MGPNPEDLEEVVAEFVELSSIPIDDTAMNDQQSGLKSYCFNRF